MSYRCLFVLSPKHFSLTLCIFQLITLWKCSDQMRERMYQPLACVIIIAYCQQTWSKRRRLLSDRWASQCLGFWKSARLPVQQYRCRYDICVSESLRRGWWMASLGPEEQLVILQQQVWTDYRLYIIDRSGIITVQLQYCICHSLLLIHKILG